MDPATADEQNRIALFAPKSLTKMDRPQGVPALYHHACLRYVSNEPTNNSSVRQRFGIAERNKATASRLIREAIEEGLVVMYTPPLVQKPSGMSSTGPIPSADC